MEWETEGRTSPTDPETDPKAPPTEEERQRDATRSPWWLLERVERRGPRTEEEEKRESRGMEKRRTSGQ